MATWSKDEQSLAPKIVYTPESGGPVGLTRLIYDPAGGSAKWVAEFAHIVNPAESVEDVKTSLGLP